MMSFGLLKGLSIPLDFDSQIKDLHYNEQMDREANIRAANKAKMFADDFQYNNAMNSFDNSRVKAFSQFQIKKIGKFVNENPDWESNYGKRAEYNSMLRELKDNPELNRGLQSDEAHKSFLKDLAEKKKAGTLDEFEYKRLSDEWTNYEKYGNQYGKDEADTKGFKEFSYMQPADKVDFGKVASERAKNLSHTTKDIGGGRTVQFTLPEYVDQSAEGIYSLNKVQADREGKLLGLSGKDYIKSLMTTDYEEKPGWNPNTGSGGGNLTRMPQATVTRKDNQTEVYTPLGKVETISIGDKQYNVNAIHSTFDKEGNITGGFAIDADIAGENNKNKRIREVENKKLNAELQKIKDKYAPMLSAATTISAKANVNKIIETLTSSIKNRRDLIDTSYPTDTDEKIPLNQQQAIEQQSGKLKVHPADIVSGAAKGKVAITENDERSNKTTQKSVSLGDIQSKVGTKGYEGYTEQELVDYYKSNGYKIK